MTDHAQTGHETSSRAFIHSSCRSDRKKVGAQSQSQGGGPADGTGVVEFGLSYALGPRGQSPLRNIRLDLAESPVD